MRKRWWAKIRGSGPGKVFIIFFSAFFLLNLNLNLVFNPCAHLLSNHILEYEIQIFGIYLHYFLYFHNISLLPLNPIFQCGFNQASNNYYLIIFILMVLFNAQHIKLQQMHFFLYFRIIVLFSHSQLHRCSFYDANKTHKMRSSLYYSWYTT